MIGVMVFSLFCQQFGIAFGTYHSNLIVCTTVYHICKDSTNLQLLNTYEL